MPADLKHLSDSCLATYGDVTIVLYGVTREALLDDPTPAVLAFKSRGIEVKDPEDLVVAQGRTVHPGLSRLFKRNGRLPHLARVPQTSRGI